ncbi:hypothetical protein EJ04DRAFT_28799 [Polyplosphaeria fusca]|uniref:Uncharacterized protein n=1 Tax=Polyplosphaeria fusca TaxID=682080 RepID=A0A9P4QTM0_9PLEO|nr:hypothetical protein EJ04DRAFT_28799 [Polyplosphaeria fusca]
MPALPIDDSLLPDLDVFAPRDIESPAMVPRQPALDYSLRSAVALGANHVAKRQSDSRPPQVIIPTMYNLSGPGPGTVVGIVLGSVGGFLLIVWLLFSLTTLGGARAIVGAGEEEVVVRRRRNSNSHRSRRSTRTEVREYSRSPRRREQIIVEERRQPRVRSVVVEERSRSRVPGDDVVEVIEEHEEYRPRRGSRRYR